MEDVGIISRIFIHLVLILTVTGRKSLKEFSVIELQESILEARKQPVCVLYKNEGISSTLEKRYVKFWRGMNTSDEYSSWMSGAFLPGKYSFLSDSHIPVGDIPKELPVIRCYIGYHTFDNKNQTSVKALSKWFLTLVTESKSQMTEASEELIFDKSTTHDLLIVGFASAKYHEALETILKSVEEHWTYKNVGVLFVHDQSEHSEHLMKTYGLKEKPAIVFIENTLKTRQVPMAVKILKSYQVTVDEVNMFLTLRYINATAINKHNYMALCGIKSKFYVPVLILFHLPSARSSQNHLSMFYRTVDYLQQFNLKMRFATMELDSEGVQVVSQHFRQILTTKLPLVAFFRSKWEKTTVVDIEQLVITTRPTLSNIVETLSEKKAFQNQHKENVRIRLPWGKYNTNKISLLQEGPLGSICTKYSSNATDNNPVVSTKKNIFKRRINLNVTMENKTVSTNLTNENVTQENLYEKDIFGNWHDRFGIDQAHRKLLRVGSLPIITTDLWQEIIEKSHVPLHPFYSGEKWQGEITKTSLVIFIIDGCGSCRRKMPLFEELYKAVKFVDGGAVYLVNCSSDPKLCKQSKITGFPTLLAYRGLGWADTSHCTLRKTEELVKPVEIEYHGVLMEKYIMEWFLKASGQAVNNLKFWKGKTLTEGQPVRLLAKLVPRKSKYLLKLTHLVVKSVYPFQCLRFACERLYGQVGCYLQYHPDVPKDQFENDDDLELIVTEIKLERQDGFSNSIMKLGKPLIDTMKEEAAANADQFHKPHKYIFPSGRVKCEDAVEFCTDHLVDFTREHGRLPVTRITLEVFHMRNNLIFQEGLPVLITLAHPANVTGNATFNEMLHEVALELYNEAVVVTIDVEEYSNWAYNFVPKDYIVFNKDDPMYKPPLHYFPRFCVIYWNDHHHAAFYPPVSEAVDNYRPFKFMKEEVLLFMKEFLKNPRKLLIETEQF